MDWNYESAINFLKPAVHDCHLKNQKYIDFTRLGSNIRFQAQAALAFLKAKVVTGEITEEQLKADLGIS